MIETTALDLIGVSEGTDKSTLVGGYLPHYDEWFTPLRHLEFNLLEIGVFHGASVRTWARYFDKAQIIGVDIDPHCRAYEKDRVHIEIGSQDDPEFLHRIVAEHPPLIIIDDGSHRSDLTIFTFERLFPALLPGGWYVIEDVHFHFLQHEAERLRGNSPVLVHDYFISIVKDRLRSSSNTGGLTGLYKYIVDAIDSVRIIPQAVAIRKARTVPDEYFSQILPYLEQSASWLNWLCYGMALRARRRPHHEVEAALRRAIEIDDSNVVVYERLADLYFETGKRGLAADTLDIALKSTRISPDREAELRQRAKVFRNG